MAAPVVRTIYIGHGQLWIGTDVEAKKREGVPEKMMSADPPELLPPETGKLKARPDTPRATPSQRDSPRMPRALLRPLAAKTPSNPIVTPPDSPLVTPTGTPTGTLVLDPIMTPPDSPGRPVSQTTRPLNPTPPDSPAYYIMTPPDTPPDTPRPQDLPPTPPQSMSTPPETPPRRTLVSPDETPPGSPIATPPGTPPLPLP